MGQSIKNILKTNRLPDIRLLKEPASLKEWCTYEALFERIMFASRQQPMQNPLKK
jgi:hypothetical protein